MSADLLANMLRGTDLSFDDIVAAAQAAGIAGTQAVPVPTVAEFYETVRSTAEAANGEEHRGGGLLRTYEPYWRLLVEGYPYKHKNTTAIEDEERLYEGCGSKPLNEVTPIDLIEARKWVERRAKLDAHWKAVHREEKGREVRDATQAGALYNYYGAARYFFKLAVSERKLTADLNPTNDLTRPPSPDGERRALSENELLEVWDVTRTGGDDPELDSLLIETVLVTGARREGLINLDLRWLNDRRSTLKLDEKGGKLVEQPATRDLLERLEAFARSRGASKPHDPVFCQKRSMSEGRPVRITDRRFDTLHTRIQTALPWADEVGLSCHWLRHHSITQVSRIGGRAVGAAFARHANTSTTGKYDKATFEEVCAAVGIMTGTKHPLAIETR